MKLENGVFEEEYITSFSQAGFHGVLTNKSFLSFMENLAEAHSSYCKFTFKDLAKDNLTWIILEWKLKVLRRPKADERIKVQTWGRFYNKVYVLRDFKLIDSKGTVCAIASSKWCLMDSVKVKIARMPENLGEIYGGINEESVFGIKDLPRLSVPEGEPTSKDEYKIRRFDLDLNHHVHNLNYLNFAYEVLPMQVFMGKELDNVEIAYKKEIKYGETIHTYLYEEKVEDNTIYTIVIKDEEDETVHSIIKLY